MRLGNLIKELDFIEIVNINYYDEEVEGIKYNSKRVQPGDLFICLTGEHVDGHMNMQKKHLQMVL